MKLLLFISLFISQSVAFGHDYFFAFSEVQYNHFRQKFEVTVVASAHDLDYMWRDSELNSDVISDLRVDSEEFRLVEEFVNEGFQLNSPKDRIKLRIIGIESLLNGVVNFYLESYEVPLPKELHVTFDLLMDEFPQQQNKMTLYIGEHTYTKAFLQNERKHTLKLEAE